MRTPRVLLFGAYGNGNLGDMIQAASLASTIKRLRPDIELSAASHLRRSDFPFDLGSKLKPDSILDHETVNGFDLLIVGGGGLLAHPHVPLGNPEWTRKLRLPVALWGVGATDFFAPQALELIQRAAFVSGRDPVSIATFSQYVDNVFYICDPVLADRAISAPGAPTVQQGICWVVCGPKQAVHEGIARAITPNDVVIAFERAVDSELASVFPQIQFVDTVQQFVHAVGRRRIVAMRYHGVILGLRLNLPVMSLLRPKGADLLGMLGLAQFSGDVVDKLPISVDQDVNRTSRILDWHIQMYEQQLTALLRRHVPSANRA